MEFGEIDRGRGQESGRGAREQVAINLGLYFLLLRAAPRESERGGERENVSRTTSQTRHSGLNAKRMANGQFCLFVFCLPDKPTTRERRGPFYFHHADER